MQTGSFAGMFDQNAGQWARLEPMILSDFTARPVVLEELAPLAGHYPCLKLGPAWWFHDSPDGMMRFREWTTDTAGFYNTVGFNDDTRMFLSIPARHAMARRVDCAFLARLVAGHQLDEDEAHEVAADLACRLARRVYKL